MILRITNLIKSNLLSIIRNKAALVATLLFPLIFLGVFGIAFQGGSQTNTTIDIGVVTGDNGVPDNAVVFGPDRSLVTGTQIQEEYLNIISELTFEDNTTKIFDITEYNQSESDTALSKVQQSSLSAILYLPDGFSLGYMAAFRNTFQNNQSIATATGNFSNYPQTEFKTEIVIQGDPTLQGFSIASSILQSTLSQFFNFGREQGNGHEVVLDTKISAQEFSTFDFIVPGLVIFGILQNLSTVATISVRDVESGLLERLKITRVNGFDYTFSLIISQLIISIVQVPIFFGVAALFGFPLTWTVGYAFLVAILMSLSITGIGMMIGSFGSDADAVGGLSAMISVPMAFLAGAFFTVPNPTIIPENTILGAHELGIMDLLPATPAIEGLRLILIGNRGITDIGFQLGLLTLLTGLYLIMGIVMYSRKYLTPNI